jgi:hypothetical protein
MLLLRHVSNKIDTNILMNTNYTNIRIISMNSYISIAVYGRFSQSPNSFKRIKN